MKEFNNIENELDPRLQQMLKAYAVKPERDPDSARRNRERFVVILNMIFEEQVPSRSVAEWFVPPAWPASFRDLRQRVATSTRMRTILFASTILLVFILFLFGGVGITAYAASSSLPGDTLYSLKTTFESARAGLTIDADSQARLYLRFAARRLSEIQALVREGRYDDVLQAASEFEKDLGGSLSAIDRLSQIDHSRAVGLSAETTVIIKSYEEILVAMLAIVPADAQPSIQNAIQASRSIATTLDAKYDDFNLDEGMDDDQNATPSPPATALPSLTSTPPVSGEATIVVLATESSTPWIIAVDTPSIAASPVPSATQPAPTAPPPQAEAGDCRGFIGAVTVENVYVPPGANCTLDGTTVTGNINVASTASLTALHVTVLGNIQADSASVVEVLAGSTIQGSIQIKSGGSARVEGVTVNGDIQLEANRGPMSAAGNQVGGNVQVFQNGGGATISNNSINGNLQCKENNPAPTGGNNTVQGNKEDQCAGL